MKLWLRAPLVNSDGDSWDAFPNNLVKRPPAQEIKIFIKRFEVEIWSSA
ncbi:unnamed protein product [Brassica oleracea var. botrytis]